MCPRTPYTPIFLEILKNKKINMIEYCTRNVPLTSWEETNFLTWLCWHPCKPMYFRYKHGISVFVYQQFVRWFAELMPSRSYPKAMIIPRQTTCRIFCREYFYSPVFLFGWKVKNPGAISSIRAKSSPTNIINRLFSAPPNQQIDLIHLLQHSCRLPTRSHSSPSSPSMAQPGMLPSIVAQTSDARSGVRAAWP